MNSIEIKRVEMCFMHDNRGFKELSCIFHKDLKSIGFGCRSRLSINPSEENINFKFDCVLERIEMGFSPKDLFGIETITSAVEFLDTCELRKNVKSYCINMIGVDEHRFTYTEDYPELDHIFSPDCGKHPMLETIEIKICEMKNLWGFGILLKYFYQHFQNLFVKRKDKLTRFSCYDIRFVFDRSSQLKKMIETTIIEPDDLEKEFITKNHNIGTKKQRYKRLFQAGTYSVDQDTIKIQIKDIKHNKQWFCLMYYNVVDWFKRTQKLAMNNSNCSVAEMLNKKQIKFLM